MSTRWEDTIDVQLAVCRHLDLNDQAREIMPDEARGSMRDEGWAKWVVGMAHRWMADATPIYVAPDMTTAWMAAEREYQPEIFRESDLLVETGFALLPGPVPITRLFTENDPSATHEPGELTTLQVRALAWGPASKAGGQDVGLIGLGFPHEQPEGAGLEGPDDGREWWLPVVHDGLEFGELHPRRDNMARAFQAFFALLRQFVPEAERLPRAERRRAQREGKPTEVKIMRLRRRQSAAQEPTGDGVNWSCQWVVSGHWRNQWYPSLGEHRQKYIAAYVKGPDDQPLRDPSRVLELVR